MSEDLTILLQRWADGDSSALNDLLPLVYDDLRKLAHRNLSRERIDHTLQPTALVHEAFLRLSTQRKVSVDNRVHFFQVAACLMRRILVDSARRRKSAKRGRQQVSIGYDAAFMAPDNKQEEWLAMDEALEKFAAIDPRRAGIVEMRYFAGFSVAEIAEVVGVSAATVRRDWAVARSWLFRALKGSMHGIQGLDSDQ